MSKADKIWADLNGLTTDAQVLNYWDNRQTIILETLKSTASNSESATNVIHRLAKSLNDREKYSSVYYLYIVGFQPIEDKLAASETLNELKFELGRGLHHNRKYDHSKRLFNELASSGFDTSRIDGWWDQSVFASTRDGIWVKTDLLPGGLRFVLFGAFVLIALYTKKYLITTILYVILNELYMAWWYQYQFSNYLKKYENLPEIISIKKNFKKMVLVDLGITILFFPLILLNNLWLYPFVFVIGAYFLIFHNALDYYYLPKLIAELNKKQVQQANSKDNQP